MSQFPTHVLQARAEHGGLFLIDELSDDALASYLRRLRLDIEEGHADAEMLVLGVARAREIQLSRFRLRMRYGATDPYRPGGPSNTEPRGTHVYDRYYRLGEPPSYWLAAAIDRERAKRGLSSVLAWPEEVAA